MDGDSPGYKDGYMVPEGFGGTPSNRWDDYEMYAAAEWFAQQILSKGGLADHMPHRPSYWAVRYAARATACALLSRAKEIGVTDLQYEQLRRTAARVATD